MLVADEVFAGELEVADLGRAVTLGHLPADAVLVDLDAGQAVAELLVDAALPEVDRLVHVAVGGDHEVLVGVAGSGGAGPALDAGGQGAVFGDVVAHRVGGGSLGGDHGQFLPGRLGPAVIRALVGV